MAAFESTSEFCDFDDYFVLWLMINLYKLLLEAADEAIRQRHGLDDDEPADTKRRQQAIKDIESEGFAQQSFSSSRHEDQNKVSVFHYVFLRCSF